MEMLKCPNCGHSYQPKEVQFMSQMDSYSMVHLTCAHCHKPVWVNFFATEKDPGLFRVSTIQKEETFLDMEEITSDEVLSFHEILKTFDGDFKGVFKKIG
jgi:uncharacterized Zn finger protein